MTSPADLVARFGSPLYVYDEAQLRERCARITTALSGCSILYAMKANANPALLEIIRDEGLGIDAVSIGEVLLARKVGFDADRISYNGNNVTDDEMRAVVDAGVHVTVDSLSQLDRYGRLFPNTSVGIRLNPDVGDGHHRHVITGGPEAKFGIDPDDLDDALAIAGRHGLDLDGLQQHIGSGILEVKSFLLAMKVMLGAARRIPGIKTVDFGGGFGIGYQDGQEDFDVRWLGVQADQMLDAFRSREPDVSFRFEPGRWVIGPCGTLHVTVTSIKRGKRHTFVGTDSGFNHLVRPTMYDAYHRIENATRPDAPVERVSVAGNVCEAGDLFASQRPLPMPEEGDVLAIRDVGAYGWSMASSYNLRPRPAEVLLRPDGPVEIRRRESLDDLNR